MRSKSTEKFIEIWETIHFHWQFMFQFRKWSSAHTTQAVCLKYITITTLLCVYNCTYGSQYDDNTGAKCTLHRQYVLYAVYRLVKCHISEEAFPSICSWKIQILLKICINLYVSCYITALHFITVLVEYVKLHSFSPALSLTHSIQYRIR